MHKDTQHKDIRHKKTQRKDTQYMALSIMTHSMTALNMAQKVDTYIKILHEVF